jgi:ribosomal-protein-alanine N-acetyltransferase
MRANRDIRDRAPVAAPATPLPSARQMSVSVTPAGWRDLAPVAALQRRAFRAGLAYRLTTLIILKLLPNVRFFVARAPASQGGRVVGCGIGDRHNNQTRIINLAVDPSARRRGVGTALLNALETALPIGSVMLMVEEENTGAQALYKRQGYVPVGNATNYYGQGRSGIWMQKVRPGAGSDAKSEPKLWV